jgi:hypothetical protein
MHERFDVVSHRDGRSARMSALAADLIKAPAMPKEEQLRLLGRQFQLWEHRPPGQGPFKQLLAKQIREE